jgi:hypothetical protein
MRAFRAPLGLVRVDHPLAVVFERPPPDGEAGTPRLAERDNVCGKPQAVENRSLISRFATPDQPSSAAPTATSGARARCLGAVSEPSHRLGRTTACGHATHQCRFRTMQHRNAGSSRRVGQSTPSSPTRAAGLCIYSGRLKGPTRHSLRPEAFCPPCAATANPAIRKCLQRLHASGPPRRRTPQPHRQKRHDSAWVSLTLRALTRWTM